MTVETKPTVTFIVTPKEQSPIEVEHIIPDEETTQAIRAYWLQWLAAQIVAEKLKRSQKS